MTQEIKDSQSISALRILCSDIKDCGRSLGVYDDGGIELQKPLVLDGEWKELRSGVFIKALFSGDSGKMALKAKAGCMMDLYETLSNHRIFVAYGEYLNTYTGELIKEDADYTVKSRELHGMDFQTDSKLIVEIVTN